VLSQNTFGFLVSLNLMVYMLVGGIASFFGPMVGTAILVIIPQVFRNLKDYVPFISAGILLIVLFTMPKGLTGLPEQIWTWIRTRKEKMGITKEETND
jgi:branched-chain amino acid transport system permease protein